MSILYHVIQTSNSTIIKRRYGVTSKRQRNRRILFHIKLNTRKMKTTQNITTRRLLDGELLYAVEIDGVEYNNIHDIIAYLNTDFDNIDNVIIEINEQSEHDSLSEVVSDLKIIALERNDWQTIEICDKLITRWEKLALHGY